MNTKDIVQRAKANLRGADLSGVDISGVDLFCANLVGANLSCANLRGASRLPIDTPIPGWTLTVAGILARSEP